MADFTERAILEVTDRSTTTVAKINAELRKLRTTAQSLAATLSGLKVDTSGLTKATATARNLAAAMKAAGANKSIKPTVDTSSIRNATVAAERLRRALRDAGAVAAKPGAATATAPGAALGAAPVASKPPVWMNTARMMVRQMAADERERNRQQATADAARWAAGRRVVAQITEERRARETADAARWAAGRRIVAQITEERRARMQAAAEAEAADRRQQAASARALRQQLAIWRQSNPTLLAMQAQQNAAARQARQQARQALAPAVIAPGAGGPASVGSTIGHYFARTASSLSYEIGRRIAYGMAHGTGEGIKSQEVASARLNLLGMTDQQKRQANAAASDLARNQKGVTEGEALGVFAEVLPVVNYDMAAAKAAAESLLNLAATQQTLGVSAKEANDKALLVFKGFAQQGNFFDHEGKVNVALMQKSFQAFNKSVALTGREANPQSFMTMMKNMGAAKYNLTEAGLIAAMHVQESLTAPKTGTGYNQAVKQLQGFAVKPEILRNLAAAGFITTEEVKEGSNGKKGRTKLVSKGSNFKDEIESDLSQFVNDRVIPWMKSRGLDPVKDAVTAARMFTSDRTATNLLAELIKSNPDIQKVKRQAAALGDNAAKAQEDSLILAKNDALAKAFTVTTNAVEGFRTPLIGLAGVTSGFLSTLNSFIAPEGRPDAGRTITAAAGATALGVGALAVGKTALSYFNPLNASAVALNGAAAALTASAGAISSAALGKALPGAAGVPAVAGAAPGSAFSPTFKATAGGALGGAALGAIQLAVDEDKVRGAAAMFGSIAGGALGGYLGGPAGAMIGVSLGGEIVKGVYNLIPDSVKQAVGGLGTPAAPPVTASGAAYTPAMLNMVRAIGDEEKRLAALVKQRDDAVARGDEVQVASSAGAIRMSQERIDAYRKEIDTLEQMTWKKAVLNGNIRVREPAEMSKEERDARIRVQRNALDYEREAANAAARERMKIEEDARAKSARVAKPMEDYKERVAALDAERRLRAKQMAEDAAAAAKYNAERVAKLIAEEQAQKFETKGGFGGEPPIGPSLSHFDSLLPGIEDAARNFDSLFQSGAENAATSMESAIVRGGDQAASRLSAAVANLNLTVNAPQAAPAAPTGNTAPK